MGYIYKINKTLLLLLISIAILAASCRHPSGDDVPDTPTGSDKAALGEEIGRAEALYGELKVSQEDGADISKDNYWVESKWKLELAIENAKWVLNNPNATAEEIQYVLDELNKAYNDTNTAKKPGKFGKTDVSQLLAFISKAQNLVSELEVSADGKNIYTDTYWITAAVKQALANAISAAQIEAAKDLSTQDAVEEALNALTAAYNTAVNAKRLGTLVANKTALQAQIATAKTKIDGVYSSADGDNIPKYETWVTPALFNNLQTAITTAEALMNEPHVRQSAVDAAVQSLKDTIAAFIPQAGLKPFDVSQLSDLITSARNLLAELQGLQESVDGTEVYEDVEWISAAQKQALANAISTAQTVADDPLVKPDAVEQALDALSAVYHTARNAKKYGTFTANKENLEAAIASAEEKMAGVSISINGLDVLTSDSWVIEDVMDALEAALTSALELNGEPYARQQAVDAAAQNLAAAIAAFNPRKGLLIPGLVNIAFARPGDETITLTGAQTLSWAENTILTVTVPETFDSYQWYVDGLIKTGETGTGISLNARSFSTGAHTLTLKVTKDGVPYTKTLTFTVN